MRSAVCAKSGSCAPLDPNLLLGYLDARHFLAGCSTLDAPAAEAAVDGLARELKVSRIAAAEGVHRIVNTNMAEGIRLVSGQAPRGSLEFRRTVGRAVKIG